MRLLRYSRIIEKGVGWLHTGVIELRPGVEFTIEDDTNSVSATTPATKEEAIAAYWHFAFGCSHFPANENDAKEDRGLRFPWDSDLVLSEACSEDFPTFSS